MQEGWKERRGNKGLEEKGGQMLWVGRKGLEYEETKTENAKEKERERSCY